MKEIPEIQPVTPNTAHELPSPHIQSSEMEKYIIEHGTESGLKESRKRLFDILAIVHEDKDALMLIDATLKSVFQYIESIYNMEISMRIAQYRSEGDEYREHVERLDNRRTQAHNALIASLGACNRYLFQNFEGQIPEGGICNLDPVAVQMNQRRAIGDWAIELEYEILSQRKD